MMKRFSDEGYSFLRALPRFTEAEVKFFDTLFRFPDNASVYFLNKELFDLEIYKFKTDTKEPIIIDCGANIGMSVIYFKMLYPDAKIMAFEPDKKIFDYLEFNTNSFRFDNVQLINKGLWSEETILKFFSEGADGGRVSIDLSGENIIEVETVKLSDYIKDTKVDFLKLDIEGAETRVLQECKEYLVNVENIYIEYHSFADEKQTLSDILSILVESGFRYYIDRTGVKSHHPFEKINQSYGFDNQLHIFGYRA